MQQPVRACLEQAVHRATALCIQRHQPGFHDGFAANNGKKPAAWAKEGLDGFGCTDLHDYMQVWELGHAQPGPRGLLVAYTKFSGAREFDGLDEDRRVATAVDSVARVHPELPRHFEGGRSKSWDQDPWARGAFAILRPGDVTRLEPHIARAEGRVHFAGEHTSPWLGGWMHSALESGERVAREINEAA